MMMKKILSTCSWPIFFLHYTLFGRETSLLEKRTPGKQTFHKKAAVCQLLFLEGEEAQVFGALWNPGFQVVDFEPGSTE